VRAAELRFTLDEATEFLKDVMELPLTASKHQSSLGWPGRLLASLRPCFSKEV